MGPPAKKKNGLKGNVTGGASNSAPDYPDRFFDGIPENAHQFGLNDGSKILDVVIGLDFGTSSTKVIVRPSNYRGDPAFAIPFGKYAHESLEYLLPTRLVVDSGGKCSFSPKADSGILTGIKVALMNGPDSSVRTVGAITVDVKCATAATAYLALVLRYVRGWFLYKKSVFQENKINWAMNLGLPAAKEDNPDLRETFDLVGKAAWLMSVRPGAITLNDACRAMEDIKHSQFKEDDLLPDFKLWPEVIAEVFGYAKSPSRNEGLHFLVDVGASTLDVCAFNLTDKEGDDYYPILKSDCKLLGAQQLHQRRIEGARNAISPQAAEKFFDAEDPLSPVPNDLTLYSPDGKLLEGVRSADEEFKEKSRHVVWKVIWHTRKGGDSYSQKWSEKPPVFMCGGAARTVDLYNRVIEEVESWINEHISSSKGIRVFDLPKPATLEANITDADYHRLAVAWGLSYEDIGTYARPSEIDDIPPPRTVDISDRYIGPEMT